MTAPSNTLAGLFGGLGSRGDKPALAEAHADRVQVVPYETLSTDIARHAEGLENAGLAAGERVLLLAHGGPDWITAFLAVVARGAVPVPLDTQIDVQTLEHIIQDSGAAWAIVDATTAELVAKAGFSGTALRLDETQDGAGWRSVKADPPGELQSVFEPEDTAVVFYTSGTTGPPKGVPLSHRNVAFQLRAVVEAGLVAEDDVILQPLPPHHVYPLIVGTLAPLALGLTIVIPETMLGPQLLHAIRAGKVTFIVGVPRLYDALVAAIESRLGSQPGPGGAYMRRAYRLSRWLRRRLGWRLGRILLYPLHRRMGPALKVLASGGGALDPEIGLRIEALGWQVASGYGLTETSPLLTINPPGNGRLDSVGRTVPGIELRIDAEAPAADSDSQRNQGEILARGDGVFGGYLNHERDEECFTADGWFRTGDLGQIDERGFVTITGRRNTLLVTSSGKNIQPDALEQRYAGHELIDEVGILMDGSHLAAVVVPDLQKAREQNVSAENAVRLALSRRGPELPSYQRITRHVLSREPLPRTRLGKIQRHKLAERYRELRADPSFQAPRAEPLPVGEMSPGDRERLENPGARRVWELLARRYPKHGLTPDTSLQLDLGIDSLGWLELGTELSQRAGVNLAEDQIADVETVRDLLELAGDGSAAEASSHTPIEQPGEFLSEEQRRWLLPLSPAARRTADLLYAIHGAGVRMLFRLQVDGLEHLPAGQWIVAPNHASFLDPSIVAAALPRERLASTYWAGWTGYAFRNALFRGISRLAQIVPVDPERAASSSVAYAAAVLEKGSNLVLFPEGERSATGELLGLKPGIGLLTAHFDHVAIVPAWIDGSLEAWPRDRALPRPRRISVRFGEALDPRRIIAADQNGTPADAITAALEAALTDLRRSR